VAARLTGPALLLYQGRRCPLCTTGRKFLPAPSLAAGRCPAAGAGRDGQPGARSRCRTGRGEGASCRARVSSMPLRPWSGPQRGTLPVCLPTGRPITRPPLLRARVRAPRPWRGGCWPQYAAALVPGRAESARTAGWAARRGRTEYPPPPMPARCPGALPSTCRQAPAGEYAAVIECDRTASRPGVYARAARQVGDSGQQAAARPGSGDADHPMRGGLFWQAHARGSGAGQSAVSWALIWSASGAQSPA
jgi:hypothetical protein